MTCINMIGSECLSTFGMVIFICVLVGFGFIFGLLIGRSLND